MSVIWHTLWTLNQFRSMPVRVERAVLVFIAVASLAVADVERASPAQAGTELEARAYSGLGSWVDLYNKRPWRHPDRVVDEMASRGVQTIYLETSSYKFREGIVHPDAVGDYIEHAHANGMTVVAWYVPSFKRVSRDYRRSIAAITYASPTGQTFDSFALDIEATVVADVDERNERTTRLARALRDAVGDDYPLGAIVPDPVGSLYWTDFPYDKIGPLFDAFLPMSYFTFRVDGRHAVRRYIRATVRAMRDRTGRTDVPVHPIGGIADVAPLDETRAYVRGVFAEEAFGGSFYDFPLMRPRQWDVLKRLRSTRVEPPEPVPPPIGHPHLL
jgi:hypothetical protein